jgi:tetratricopeptide (TPR) repeat protein
MQEALMHPENSNSNFKAPEEKKIDQITYIKNLEINFLKNKNLVGRVINKNIKTNNGNYNYKLNRIKNLDRAIKDFEGIINFIEKDHAIAHYCLAQAYRQKNKHEEVKKHINKVSEIISDPKYKKWANYFNELVPKNEFDEFKNYSINKNFSNVDNPRSKMI